MGLIMNVLRSLDISHNLTSDDLIAAIEQRMLVLLDPENSSSSVSKNIKQQSKAINASIYHLKTGGQRMRAKLCVYAGLALNLSNNNIICIAAACELIHNASLIHDDIQDRDEYRRDKKTVWALYGDSISICTGDLFLSAAYRSLSDIDQPKLIGKLIHLIHERVALVIHGQCADLEAKDKLLDDINLYEKVVIAKSGALIGLPLELCLILANMDKWLSKIPSLVEPFSIGYQILDDIKDLKEDAASENKQRSLNAILILEQAQHDLDPILIGSEIARIKFHQVAKIANEFPNNMVGKLAEIALQMAKQV